MRILIVHNHYGSENPSGENEVVQLEQALLTEHGHEVQLFRRDSDTIRSRGVLGAVQGAAAVPWNPFEARRMAQWVARFRPDIVHAHNTFPLISAAVFGAASQAGARVLTLHNYRLFCAAAIPMRDGRTCTDCIVRQSVAPALRYGCYRGSRAATLPLAAGIALHRLRRTWLRDVEAFIALTPFQRDQMVHGGLPADRVEVKPNFYPTTTTPLAWSQRLPQCVFAGRLSAEKGVAKLVRAWTDWGASAPELLLIGDGPQRGMLEAAAQGANVRFLGRCTAAQTQAEIARSRMLILPSEWFEGFPMTVREAFAFGTPAAVSRLGPLPSLVANGRCGLLLDPFDAAAVCRSLQQAWQDQAKLEELGKAGHAEFLARYTADANHTQLMQIYQRAIARR
jgi:glycosyltransferase involved in cell wall biosynthesis